jgi:hypothetical protein
MSIIFIDQLPSCHIFGKAHNTFASKKSPQFTMYTQHIHCNSVCTLSIFTPIHYVHSKYSLQFNKYTQHIHSNSLCILNIFTPLTTTNNNTTLGLYILHFYDIPHPDVTHSALNVSFSLTGHVRSADCGQL